nr:MAG TPA: hypothetical protein [Caudoviricetes sp.]DAS67682.1 MAG TPA: hypothetical protein [Caudoviricetes sp.]
MQKSRPKVITTRQTATVKTEAMGCSLMSLKTGVQ